MPATGGTELGRPYETSWLQHSHLGCASEHGIVTVSGPQGTGASADVHEPEPKYLATSGFALTVHHSADRLNDDEEVVVGSSRPSIPAWRWVASFASPVSIVAWLFLAIGMVGFHPSDDGMLLAQTQRILRGDVPHLDVIFARPLGSAYLHMLDFVLPMPLFEASRLVGIAMIVGYSYLFAWVIFGMSPPSWRLAHHLGAVGAVLINLHTFPSMSWYTTDGILFVALGLALLTASIEKGVTKTPVVALLALGLAPVMKQSFFLAPVLGVVWLALARSRSGRKPRILRMVGWTALPGLVYCGGIAAFGAFSEFTRQILGAEPVWGELLASALTFAPVVTTVLGVGGLMAIGAFLSHRRQSVEISRPDGEKRILVIGELVARLGATAAILALPIASQFGYRGVWGLTLVWILAVTIVIRWIAGHSDPTGIAIAAVAWMACLSWGYPYPNLVAGTAALFLIHRTWTDFKSPASPSWLRRTGLILPMLAVTGLGLGLIDARENAPYRDLPVSQLSEQLSRISPEFGRIRTNPVTFMYLAQMADCIEEYPAASVAVLPDNPGIYPALGLRQPFPMDWMFENDTAGHNERIVEAAKELDRTGGYLVLFQTFAIEPLPALTDLDPVTTDAVPFSYDGSLTAGILGELSGQRIACGSFVGVYSP